MPNIDDLLTVFQLLARAGVPFVIIGGHAVNFHGYVRATEDADLVFQRSSAAEAALLFGFAGAISGEVSSWS